MFSIKAHPLPDNALLTSYRQSGDHTDCYRTELPFAVTHSQYVRAFYTTKLFKLERLILKWLVGKPSSDAQADLLAKGQTQAFAAWEVELRCENQLLLCDYLKRTRSWLMIEQRQSEKGMQTLLYFGSGVVANKNAKTGGSSFGFAFHALSWFHKLYSVALLSAAKSRLIKLNERNR